MSENSNQLPVTFHSVLDKSYREFYDICLMLSSIGDIETADPKSDQVIESRFIKSERFEFKMSILIQTKPDKSSYVLVQNLTEDKKIEFDLNDVKDMTAKMSCLTQSKDVFDNVLKAFEALREKLYKMKFLETKLINIFTEVETILKGKI